MSTAAMVAAAVLGGLQFLGLRRWIRAAERRRPSLRTWCDLAEKLDALENRRRP